MLDLLAEAGGPNNDAYQEKIVVVNRSCRASEARVFDLMKFAKSGDFSQLPVVRPDDTFYVPNVERSDRAIVMPNIRDAVSVLSIIGLLEILI